MQKERWSAAIDVAGSHTLANICASMKYGGTVAACGLAQGFDFSSTVMPFILRGVSLCGIDSVYASKEHRQQAWGNLARDLDMGKLETMTREIKRSPRLFPRLQLICWMAKCVVACVVNVQA